MRHEKTVIVKNPWLRRIRNDLRRLYDAHYFPILTAFTDEEIETKKENSKIFIGSICNCPSCNRINKDMIYNKLEGKWYCIECYTLIKARETDRSDWPLDYSEIALFIDLLAGPDECQYNGREWRCGGKEFVYAHKILDFMLISKDKQEEFLTYCRAFGGYCDCEILMNAAPHLLGKETPY